MTDLELSFIYLIMILFCVSIIITSIHLLLFCEVIFITYLLFKGIFNYLKK